nr:MAG TPA: hypothetical protein [Caudoviricetes sp.]
MYILSFPRGWYLGGFVSPLFLSITLYSKIGVESSISLCFFFNLYDYSQYLLTVKKDKK